jgi:hypothetical protein
MAQAKVAPISKAEMVRRLNRIDYIYRNEISEKLRLRWGQGHFMMSDMVKLTGRSQEYLIKIEAEGKIPKAKHVTKKRFYRWDEEQAREIIARIESGNLIVPE